MQTHGKGPKDVLVRLYARWKRGKRELVPMALRSVSPKLSHRKSSKQLDFGFDQPGVAR
jgi:hypothetical protein